MKLKKLPILIFLFGLIIGYKNLELSNIKITNQELVSIIFENTLPKDKDGEVSEEAIKNAISRYVAINSEFKNRGLSIDSEVKGALSATVNNLWHLYGSYYNEIGVSKQTIYKKMSSKIQFPLKSQQKNYTSTALYKSRGLYAKYNFVYM